MVRNLLSSIVFIVKTVLLSWAIIVLISLVLVNYLQHKNTSKQSDTHLLMPEKSKIQKVLPEKKESPCHETEKIVLAFLEKIPFKKNGDVELNKEMENALLHDESIERLVISNDKCGSALASRLANIYSAIKLKEKANFYHEMVLKFAKNNNLEAVDNLCWYDSMSTKKQKIYFCKKLVDKNIPLATMAVQFLGQLYYEEEKEDDLINLCNKSDNDKILFCHTAYLFPLAKKLYREQKYERAISFYEKIEPDDTKGYNFIANDLAEMYLNGKGTDVNYPNAILWYEKALEKNYSDKIYSHILNNLCVTYDHQKDFVTSFKCYKQAAIMGNALAQRNLAIKYLNGYGTIQDYQEAYAWLNVAIAQGLDENQVGAEKIKNWLIYNLKAQDKTGDELIHAKKLAHKYYKKYVLHEVQVAKKVNKSISSRVNAAINDLIN